MRATVGSVTLEGTPEEIAKYMDITSDGLNKKFVVNTTVKNGENLTSALRSMAVESLLRPPTRLNSK